MLKIVILSLFANLNSSLCHFKGVFALLYRFALVAIVNEFVRAKLSHFPSESLADSPFGQGDSGREVFQGSSFLVSNKNHLWVVQAQRGDATLMPNTFVLQTC